MKAGQRGYPPEKVARLSKQLDNLVETCAVYPDPEAVHSNAAMALPRGNSYEMVTDYQVVQVDATEGYYRA